MRISALRCILRLMAGKKTVDLSQGSVGRLLFSLSVPTITSQLVNMLYNMVDRIFFINLDPASTGLFDGRVVDMLDFCGIWNAVFNVADSFVVVGVFLFLFAFIRNDLKMAKEKKRALQQEADAQEAQEPADNSQKDEQHD